MAEIRIPDLGDFDEVEVVEVHVKEGDSVKEGDPILLQSEVGQLRGRCKIVPIKARNLQVHWPEGSVLLKRGAVDPLCGIPDYNTQVTVVRFEGDLEG